MQKLLSATIQNLIGKKIIHAENDWIELDNGRRIYLETSEIEMLNDDSDDESLAEKLFFKSHPELNP